jgi:hypothetical protein
MGKSIPTNLQKLAQLKIKIDILTEKYEKDKETYQKQLTEPGERLVDVDSGLALVMIQTERRSFNVDGVKANGGQECVEESVSAKKFDAKFKKGEKYLLSEDKLQACFTTSKQAPYVNWEGLKEYRRKIEALLQNTVGKVIKEEEKPNAKSKADSENGIETT